MPDAEQLNLIKGKLGSFHIVHLQLVPERATELYMVQRVCICKFEATSLKYMVIFKSLTDVILHRVVTMFHLEYKSNRFAPRSLRIFILDQSVPPRSWQVVRFGASYERRIQICIKTNKKYSSAVSMWGVFSLSGCMRCMYASAFSFISEKIDTLQIWDSSRSHITWKYWNV